MRATAQQKILALLRANTTAARMRCAAAGEPERSFPPLMRGAPTHSVAFFLTALERDGWTLARIDGEGASS